MNKNEYRGLDPVGEELFMEKKKQEEKKRLQRRRNKKTAREKRNILSLESNKG